MATGTVFATIRKCIDGDYEWIDLNGISGSHGAVIDAAKALDAKMPHWSKANPVIRTARITLSEDPIVPA
jgi:hypothetical protein